MRQEEGLPLRTYETHDGRNLSGSLALSLEAMRHDSTLVTHQQVGALLHDVFDWLLDVFDSLLLPHVFDCFCNLALAARCL